MFQKCELLLKSQNFYEISRGLFERYICQVFFDIVTKSKPRVL